MEVLSTLGGNCRIRVPNELVSVKKYGLKPANGDNPNPFFENPEIKAPLTAQNIKMNKVSLKQTYLYDLPTKPGKKYLLSKL